jgi:hypothetical protein
MLYITHSTDTAALIAEVESLHPELISRDEEAGEVFILKMTKRHKTLRVGDETIQVVRNLDERLQSLTSLNILATLPDGAPPENSQAALAGHFTSPEAQAIYEALTGVMVPMLDDDGGEHVKPYLIGIS